MKFRLGICSDSGCCRISLKNDQQIDYILSNISENVFLNACPGSGKTESVGFKAAYEINRWDRPVGGIAVLTFTNNAADEIKERASMLLGDQKVSYPHFIGTIDSWLHGYVAHPFSYQATGFEGVNRDCSVRLVNDDDYSDWLNGFKLKTAYKTKKGSFIPIYTNNINFDGADWHINIQGLDESVSAKDFYYSDTFQEFIKDKEFFSFEFFCESFRKEKCKFNQKGFATYQDMENFCYKLLADEDILRTFIQRFPLIIIDECQDLSPSQLLILDVLASNGVVLHFIGDMNQAIYEFKKVSPEMTLSFIEGLSFIEKELSVNYRSNIEIVRLCNSVIDNKSEVISGEVTKFESSCIAMFYQKDQVGKLGAWFDELINQINRNEHTLKSNTILTRSWKNVRRIKSLDKDRKEKSQYLLANSIFLWSKGDIELKKEALSGLGKFIYERNILESNSANRKNYYRPDIIDSDSRWRVILNSLLANIYNQSLLSDLNWDWGKWAKAVRDNFCELLRHTLTTHGFVDIELGKFNFNKPSGDSGSVISSLKHGDVGDYNIPVMTIHSVKGQTFDSVMLVSSPSNSGKIKDGYWKTWLEDTSSEAARLAYVASSRPKHLLVWAVPKTGDFKADRETLEKLGFLTMECGESVDIATIAG